MYSRIDNLLFCLNRQSKPTKNIQVISKLVFKINWCERHSAFWWKIILGVRVDTTHRMINAQNHKNIFFKIHTKQSMSHENHANFHLGCNFPDFKSFYPLLISFADRPCLWPVHKHSELNFGLTDRLQHVPYISRVENEKKISNTTESSEKLEIKCIQIIFNGQYIT